MKCPICGNALRISKKNPNFALCDECRKKFRIPQKEKAVDTEEPQTAATATPPVEQETEASSETQVFSREEVKEALKKQEAKNAAKAQAARTSEPASADDGEDFHLRYANIPPKAVREKREQEMRSAYDELLSIGREEREKRKKRGFWSKRQS